MDPQSIVQVELVNTGLSISDYVGIISVIGAWIAVIISVVNTRHMKDSLKLLVDQELRNQPKISLSSERSLRYVDKVKDVSLYAFKIQISNESDIPNSIKSAELRINYQNENMDLQIVLKAVDRVSFEDCKLEICKLPVSLSERAAMTTWILYEMKNSDLTQLRVNSYDIEIIDTFNNKTIESIILVNGVDHIDQLA